ncbi:hypothetical protein NM688_g1329 [Phlebia brevispora]|uniref:Uncharacterized protein n=1 Tax=Phlebia brevispora TaxID=194682 RepID=A0ACC1TC20_9APHY|nr:hypothetical protein NM688_g1329 [Phlebia brevispora]
MPAKRSISPHTRKRAKISNEDDVGKFSATNSTHSEKCGSSTSGEIMRDESRQSEETLGSTTVCDRRQQLGILQPLLGVPVEMFLEILRYLSPLDLLHLSRTSKRIRAVLMSRSSSRLWAAAWKNEEDLPPCPDDITAPAFTHLLYKSRCHRCNHSKGDIAVYWLCRARYCKSCADHITSHHKFNWNDIEYGFCPEEYPLVFLIPGLKEYSDYDNASRYARTFVSARLDDILKFVQAWRAVAYEDKERFLEEQKKELRERHEHAKICSEWKAKQDKKDKARKELARYNTIIARLQGDGWTEVLADLTKYQTAELKEIPGVRSEYSLTDEALKVILPRLIQKLEVWRKQQEKSHRDATIKERMIRLDNALLPIPEDHNTRPSLRDVILSMPEARDFIGAPFRDAVAIDPVLEALPSFVEGWRRAQYGHLMDLVRQGAAATNVRLTTDPLILALGSVFMCHSCCTLVSLADALNHYCNPQSSTKNTALSLYLKGSGMHMKDTDWYLTKIPCALFRDYGDVVRLIHPIITACGYNPATATSDDMDSSNIRLVCTRCSGDKEQLVMTWRAAISHLVCPLSLQKSSSGGNTRPCRLKKASGAEVDVVKKFETKQLSEWAGARKTRCARCPVSKRHIEYAYERFRGHLSSHHGIEESGDKDGFYATAFKRVWDEPLVVTYRESRR